MRTFLLSVIRNDSEVATMTVKLWSNMFTGKSSTVLQLSFHDGISFLSPNWQTISCFINLLRKIKLAKVENFENMRTFWCAQWEMTVKSLRWQLIYGAKDSLERNLEKHLLFNWQPKAWWESKSYQQIRTLSREPPIKISIIAV